MSEIPSLPQEFFCVYIPRELGSGLPARSSNGSLAVRVPEAGEWSYHVERGQLVASSGTRDDCIALVTIPLATFESVVRRAAEVMAESKADPSRQVPAFRALALDPERVALIRGVRGTVSFTVTDGAEQHRLYVTAGSCAPNLESAECDVACDAGVFLDLQTGRQNPFELLMNGKIRVSGNAQILMALSALFT